MEEGDDKIEGKKKTLLTSPSPSPACPFHLSPSRVLPPIPSFSIMSSHPLFFSYFVSEDVGTLCIYPVRLPYLT